ncbi:alpha/beta fold hydrolase [Streptomyces sp. 24-1644]|uniref:alpha/beta fold hydrolase n=1 Tax=Streptomyces sp. 24-1644 TaxID=3457315 RepID=UPI003FA7BDAB
MPIFHAYDGTELAYRLVGEGEPLICLPDGPMRTGSCPGDLGGLSAARRLVLPDLRGSGDSAAPDDPATYRCDRLVEDVEALREHLGLERIDLLGHSASADLAALYAARYPHRLLTLTLVTPGTHAVGIAVTDEDRLDASGLRSHEPRDAEARSLPHQEGSFGPAATVDALRRLQAPVLVLAGEYDGSPTPDRAAELAALFPHGEFVVQRGAGHFPWLDDPGAFARTVRAFLDPRVGNVQAGGIRIAYRTWGEPTAPPVVLAHGRCGSSRDWTVVAERLAADHRVYAFDFRGHGLSEWTGRYSFELFRDDLHAFLEARNLSGATVVGHSMGGVAAYLLAEREPGLIGRLVVEDAPPLHPLDPPRPLVERPDGEIDFDWPVVPAIDAQLNDPGPVGRERLGEITAPTLVIGGGPRSHIVQDHLAWMAEQIPGGRFVTIDAGHLVHTARPDEFLAALRSFGMA